MNKNKPLKDKNQIAKALKALRKSKNMTQGKLAEKTDMQYTYISKLERGLVDPRISTLLKIKEALGVSGNELLGEMDKSLTGVLRRQFEKIKKLDNEDIKFILKTIDLVITKSILRKANPDNMSYDEFIIESHCMEKEENELKELEYLRHIEDTLENTENI